MTGPPTASTWTADPFVPASRSLRTLQRAVQECTGCPLHADTTQAVFGEGARNAPIVLVGEQHKKSNTAEVEACHPWIAVELRADDAATEIRAALVQDLRRARGLATAESLEGSRR